MVADRREAFGASTAKGAVGTFALPAVERSGTFGTARKGDKLHESLSSLGGTRTRARVSNGSTNRPVNRRRDASGQRSNGSLTAKRGASGGSSPASGTPPSRPASQASSGSCDMTTKPLTLLRTQDRLKLRNSCDKLYGKKQADIRQVFRSFDTNRDGTLDAQEIKAGLDRYNFGLSEEEVQRLMLALDKDGNNSVDYQEFMNVMDNYTPLGPYTQNETDHALQVTAPWMPIKTKKFTKWDAEPCPTAPFVDKNAKQGSLEQQQADRRTTNLISSRFYQAASRIRHVFRKLDIDKNGMVDREEFCNGVAKLGMGIPPVQVERFFDHIDQDGSGAIDYVEFLRRFEEEPDGVKPPPPARNGVPVSTKLGLTVEDVAAVAGSDKVAALRERIHATAHPASLVFRKYDRNNDGYLSLDEFTKCCQDMVSSMTEQECACLMTDIDPNGDGYLSYPDFVDSLAAHRPPHPRQAHASPAAPLDNTYQAMQGGTRERFGGSCVPHGPGEEPVNHPTVARVFERVNKQRTEARAPALSGLWTSLNASAVAGLGGYAPGKRGAVDLARQAALMTGSRPSTAPSLTPPDDDDTCSSLGELNLDPSTPQPNGSRSRSAASPSKSRGSHSSSINSRPGITGWSSRTAFGFGPSPGAPGGARTGVDLDQEWGDAWSDARLNRSKNSPWSDTSSVTVPRPDCASAWDRARHYEPRGGVGGIDPSPTTAEREAKAAAKTRASQRFANAPAAIAARQKADQAFEDRQDAGRLRIRTDQRARAAERQYFYSQFVETAADRHVKSVFMRKF